MSIVSLDNNCRFRDKDINPGSTLRINGVYANNSNDENYTLLVKLHNNDSSGSNQQEWSFYQTIEADHIYRYIDALGVSNEKTEIVNNIYKYLSFSVSHLNPLVDFGDYIVTINYDIIEL